MKSDWATKKLLEITDLNPRESIPKGSIAKKISMDKLQPFCRDVVKYVGIIIGIFHSSPRHIYF